MAHLYVVHVRLHCGQAVLLNEVLHQTYAFIVCSYLQTQSPLQAQCRCNDSKQLES